MDIKEMAKTMTREEFMNKFTENKYILVINKKRYCCPDEIGLKILGDGNECWTNDSNNRCKECWENAIKNIKFKGEYEMITYNEDILEKVLEGAKNKIVVHYSSKEEFKNILELCKDRKIRWNMGEYIKIEEDLRLYNLYCESRYIKIEDNKTTVGELNDYKGYKIMEYKDLLKKDSYIHNFVELVKKYYDKEYTIQELFDFEEGLKFVTLDDAAMEVKIIDGCLWQNLGWINGWVKSEVCKEWIGKKFKLKKPEIDLIKIEDENEMCFYNNMK